MFIVSLFCYSYFCCWLLYNFDLLKHFLAFSFVTQNFKFFKLVFHQFYVQRKSTSEVHCDNLDSSIGKIHRFLRSIDCYLF